jgi:hypothetical protein
MISFGVVSTVGGNDPDVLPESLCTIECVPAARQGAASAFDQWTIDHPSSSS